jgi:phosphoribosylaminoimidazole-succinocarboxamide synthase
VRDVYRTAADPASPLLIVATDRLSAFDVVMPTPVPGKGRLLTQMSLGWFAFLRGLGAKLPRPSAILVASAHWETASSAVSAAATPATDGQRVVSYCGSFGLVCHDFEG